jgi:SAM-dependent methyltransferase
MTELETKWAPQIAYLDPSMLRGTYGMIASVPDPMYADLLMTGKLHPEMIEMSGEKLLLQCCPIAEVFPASFADSNAVVAFVPSSQRMSNYIDFDTQTYKYWSDRKIGDINGPDKFGDSKTNKARSAYIQRLIEKANISKRESIFEVGCNCGRNLAHLRDCGYPNVSGLDISPAAIEIAKAQGLTVECRPLAIEEKAKYDVVFSLATLQHVFDPKLLASVGTMAMHTIITVEDETGLAWMQVARNYGEVFTALGFEQMHTERVPEDSGLPDFYVARILKRPYKGQL